ncbi:ubiquitin-like protein [Coniochaeta sp. 2T2.1]|nr:ubiquitin-like protein [Coniochaeta sp. 2T2.1]
MGDSPPPRAERPRSRSRSPPRKINKSTSGGFRWKEKRSTNDDGGDDRRGLDRGYRNRSPRRDNRDRDRDSDRRRGDDRDDRYKPDSYPRRDRDSDRDRDRDSARDSDRTKERKSKDPERKKKDKPAKSPAAPAPPSGGGGGGEEMIVITVNDRLGTKAQIPCFPSDKIKDLRVLVAARVGRKPHEILLKRQGERPFKDQLSLEDYGISSGVQLDLEVDTGD